MAAPTRPAFPQSLVDAFREAPGVPAFEYRSRPVSRGEVLDLVGRFAAGLTAAGLGPRRSVAIAAEVTPWAFAAQIAAHLLGCRVVGLRPGLTGAQLVGILGEDTDAVLTDQAEVRPELLAAVGGGTLLRLGPDLLDKHPEPASLTPLGRPEDIALVHLTSGSTGRPKGCAVSYAAMTAHWTWQRDRWSERTRALADHYRRYLLFGTLTSAVIFEHLGLCLLGGGTAVIPDPPPRFPEVFAEHRVTACLMTVPRLHQVLDTLRTQDIDTSSLRALLVAGSPLAPHRLAEAVERLGPVVHHAYGQTETGLLTILTPGELAADPARLDSVGRAIDTVELSVRDEHGAPLPSGAVGELWVRTEGALTGYWGDTAESGQVLRGSWVATRDLAAVDDAGFVRLTGRIRDVIIVNAIVHYAGPIERALARHPDVDQAYVAGAPDDATGEAAHAFVVPRADRVPDAGELAALVAAELGQAAVPATITTITDVPVAASGKPDKKALLRLLPAD